jgi:hypothetical protein
MHSNNEFSDPVFGTHETSSIIVKFLKLSAFHSITEQTVTNL